MPTQVIGHVDADCFYCSAERVRFPALRGQPLGVIGNQGACVIAKSYELKAHGVKTGQPIWEAVDLCPEAIFLKRDFAWYEVLSKLLLEQLRSVSPRVEYYSIDEMFFDASELPNVFRRPLPEAARALQMQVLEQVGIPVSMGISTTRTVAKLASDLHKPFGVSILLERREIDAFLATEPAGEISGIGKKSAAKLSGFGINTCLDYAQANRFFVQKLLTVKGEAIWWELRGESVIPIVTVRPDQKRIGRGGSLGESTKDRMRLTAWIIRNLERLVEELDFHKVHTSLLIFILEYKGGGGWARKVPLPEPTSSFELLSALCVEILGRWPGDELVNAMHIDAERLTKRARAQLRLFSRNIDSQEERVAEVKAAINEKLGRFKIRSASTLPLTEIYHDEAHHHEICDVHGKMCF